MAELENPTTGDKVTVDSPVEQVRLRAQGYRVVDEGKKAKNKARGSESSGGAQS